MGKSKGEGGRSKNRPSSSSLAASLSPSGGSSFGFGGYLGSSRIESSSVNEETGPAFDVDAEMSQHLKRLGRKDPTTKVKALTSLSILFKQTSGEELVQIVPKWAFEYKKLLYDYSREVRRATHEAMANLVATVGRGLAPHLKSLMGPWWFSQFDPISEISQAARRSLEAAFSSQEKRFDALVLCRSEIFLYLDENLRLKPQEMMDKSIPMDQLEEMHQLVISSSLLSVATLVDVLLGIKLPIYDSENLKTGLKGATKVRQTVISSAEKIFSTHKFFLEFVKSKNPRVRSATYSILASYIKHIPHVFNEENIKPLSAVILGAFQEKDASCHSSMWDMILLFSRKFPDCWSHGNKQKSSFAHFWLFLRNGCYGSQQVSYPILILFLDAIPPKTVIEDFFLMNFFQNLWLGRNPHSSSSDQLALFEALKECFLWGLFSTTRFFPEEDSFCHFQVTLIHNILVMLLWHDYLLIGGKDVDGQFSGISSGSTKDDPRLNYPTGYLQELARCIIGILSNISSRKSSLLVPFCASFWKDCMDILQQEENMQKYSVHTEQIVNFLLLLDQHATQKNETWPLEHMAGPLFAKLFPLIKSLDSSDAVKLLRTIVDIFGPRTVVSHLFVSGKEQYGNMLSVDGDEKVMTEFFLQTFSKDFVPWCLQEHICSSSSRLDLLISLLDEELFSEQWALVMTHVRKLQEYPGTNHILVLAMLMEKIKEKMGNRNLGIKSLRRIAHPECWQHDLLDSVAVSIICQSPPFGKSDVRFLCAVLGGSSEDDQTCFLSGETVCPVFEAILKNLVAFLATSSFNWAKSACSLLLACETQDVTQKCKISFMNTLEMAQFAFDILAGSVYCLKRLDEDCGLIASILAAIFIIGWKYNITSEAPVNDNSEIECITETSLAASPGKQIISDDVCLDYIGGEWALGKRVYDFQREINISFLRSLSSFSRAKLEDVLVQTIRSAVFETDISSADRTATLCCKWVLHLFELICRSSTEEQLILSKLFSEGESWTFWAIPSSSNGRSAALQTDRDISTHESRHQSFVAFVNKLVLNHGVDRVIAGSAPPIGTFVAEASTEHSVSPSAFSRSWLAAELLCSWKWQGGSAMESFLPLLNDLAKREISSEGSIIYCIAKILIDGAISNGATCPLTFLNPWIVSDYEVENVQDPFLRALVSLLLTLIIKYNTWTKREACLLLEYTMDKLFVGTEVNLNCLKIFPFLLNVIVQPLLTRVSDSDESKRACLLDSSNEELVHSYISGWLEKALSLQPLALGQARENDLEEWIQVVISCYPLSITRENRNIRIEALGGINHLERISLLSLFRKQRCSLEAGSSATIQIMLANLTAVSVGYCWGDFGEDDWDFVLSQLRRWMDLTVLMMEETTENVDAAVTGFESDADLGNIVRKLELAVQIIDPLPIHITKIALTILSLFCQLGENGKLRITELLETIRYEKWDSLKDNLLEHVLRLFFTAGVTEAIASSFGEEASSVIASSRLAHTHFWELVGFCVINSPAHVRTSAVQSMELWGVSKGPITALYAILFSLKPISSLQLAAFHILSSEPVCHLSVVKESCLDDNVQSEHGSHLLHGVESSVDESICLRDELSCIIEKPSPEILKMDLVLQLRVNVFLAWSLLLSYLQLLPSSSPSKEKLVLCIQDSVSPIILDFVFQHIPLKVGSLHSLKKKEAELPVETMKAANAAKHAITTCSLLFAIESFWPVGVEQMSLLSGSIYGLMIRLLPAYVRNWFTNLRDRSLSQAIESFTKLWCSPPLFSEELSQVKGAAIADDNFSVTVNKSALEIIATYKKEETGMDLVIHLPSCYPLRPVDVDCTRSLGVSEVKQRKWLLSLTAFVCNQNGAIAEAIRIWKNNLDREFEGVEECPICYSIIHTTNHSLPRLACKTCKHKFHSACLYKWFSTSHKSTCPLCQTPF
uniref:E3 ubiquitin-protein ligase listerin n=2 Tax=Anthurium amnicola TaxID=1678845 RepID=A0A1D1ZG63_9ARAE